MGEFDSLFANTPAHSQMEKIPFGRVVESYLRYYASGQGHTARAKRLDLQHFTEFLACHCGYSKPAKLKVKDWNCSAVQRFVDESLAGGESPATVARRLATIKHMGRTLAEQVPGFVNPAKKVRTPKVHAARPQTLETAEVKAVRTKAKQRKKKKDSFIRQRNETLFNLLIDTGIRADEVRLLKFGQLDPELEWVENLRTKGQRYRNLSISSEMRPVLEKYLLARQQELKKFYAKLTKKENRTLPLFISTYNAVPGSPETFLMGAKTIWRAINELSAGVELHPHMLRHSYAVDLLEDCNDVRLVAQALGHSDVRITKRYTEPRSLNDTKK